MSSTRYNDNDKDNKKPKTSSERAMEKYLPDYSKANKKIDKAVAEEEDTYKEALNKIGIDSNIEANKRKETIIKYFSTEKNFKNNLQKSINTAVNIAVSNNKNSKDKFLEYKIKGIKGRVEREMNEKGRLYWDYMKSNTVKKYDVDVEKTTKENGKDVTKKTVENRIVDNILGEMEKDSFKTPSDSSASVTEMAKPDNQTNSSTTSTATTTDNQNADVQENAAPKNKFSGYNLGQLTDVLKGMPANYSDEIFKQVDALDAECKKKIEEITNTAKYFDWFSDKSEKDNADNKNQNNQKKLITLTKDILDKDATAPSINATNQQSGSETDNKNNEGADGSSQNETEKKNENESQNEPQVNVNGINSMEDLEKCKEDIINNYKNKLKEQYKKLSEEFTQKKGEILAALKEHASELNDSKNDIDLSEIWGKFNPFKIFDITKDEIDKAKSDAASSNSDEKKEAEPEKKAENKDNENKASEGTAAGGQTSPQLIEPTVDNKDDTPAGPNLTSTEKKDILWGKLLQNEFLQSIGGCLVRLFPYLPDSDSNKKNIKDILPATLPEAGFESATMRNLYQDEAIREAADERGFNEEEREKYVEDYKTVKHKSRGKDKNKEDFIADTPLQMYAYTRALLRAFICVSNNVNIGSFTNGPRINSTIGSSPLAGVDVYNQFMRGSKNNIKNAEAFKKFCADKLVDCSDNCASIINKPDNKKSATIEAFKGLMDCMKRVVEKGKKYDDSTFEKALGKIYSVISTVEKIRTNNTWLFEGEQTDVFGPDIDRIEEQTKTKNSKKTSKK